MGLTTQPGIGGVGMISLRIAPPETEPRPRYRPGMERPLPDYSHRLRLRAGCTAGCISAHLSHFRESDDETSPAHWRRAVEAPRRLWSW